MGPTHRVPALALLLAASLGCYHATVETGAAPSTIVLRKAFAPAWVYGLVPPNTIETAERCRNGVATVETRLSFVNQLVSFLTLGIYTPMEITVTCAAARSASTAGARGTSQPSPERLEAALADGIARSLEEQRAVHVSLD